MLTYTYEQCKVAGIENSTLFLLLKYNNIQTKYDIYYIIIIIMIHLHVYIGAYVPKGHVHICTD